MHVNEVAASGPEERLRIDAHQHFWTLARGDYDWLTPELGVLYRDWGPAELAPQLDEAGIDATVLVQAAATFAETRYLLALAEQTPRVAGVVGWVDFEAQPRDLERCLDEIAAHPFGVGVRPMIQDIDDPDWMLAARVAPAFEMLVERDLRFDALIRPLHLESLLELLARHPALRCVVDHGAKPEIATGRREPWARDLARIAAETGAFCKLSGLASEAAPGWTPEELAFYVEALLAGFGPARVLWGSDWPVVEAAGGYQAWHRACRQLLAQLDEPQRDGIFGGTAIAFYGLACISRRAP